MPNPKLKKNIEEMMEEFNEYNADSGGLLYPNRNESWLKEKLTSLLTTHIKESIKILKGKKFKKYKKDDFLERGYNFGSVPT